MICIKDMTVLRTLSRVPMYGLLWDVVGYAIDHLMKLEKDTEPVITSYYRNGDKGVHGTRPCRGIDLRTWNYPSHVVMAVVDKINQRFIYDPDRPHMNCALYHDVGKGIHLHLQVHPATIRRKDDTY
jgi:hypothetical protein